MLNSVFKQRSNVSLFCPLIRYMHRGSCGSHFDDPPCPPQDPPKPPFNCESWNIKRKKPGPIEPEPRCGPGDSKGDAKGGCGNSSNPNQPIFNKPECCNAACPDLLPRYDDMFYKVSDKAKRCYRQTWIECPAPIKKQKVMCYSDKTPYPPMEKRPKQSRPQTACNMMKKDCGLEKNLKCIRLILPGCRSSRGSFHCLTERNPRGPCPNRRCSPYPSFSECARQRNFPIKPTECLCTAKPSICEVWSEIEKAVRMGQMKKLIK